MCGECKRKTREILLKENLPKQNMKKKNLPNAYWEKNPRKIFQTRIQLFTGLHRGDPPGS